MNWYSWKSHLFLSPFLLETVKQYDNCWKLHLLAWLPFWKQYSVWQPPTCPQSVGWVASNHSSRLPGSHVGNLCFLQQPAAEESLFHFQWTWDNSPLESTALQANQWNLLEWGWDDDNSNGELAVKNSHQFTFHTAFQKRHLSSLMKWHFKQQICWINCLSPESFWNLDWNEVALGGIADWSIPCKSHTAFQSMAQHFNQLHISNNPTLQWSFTHCNPPNPHCLLNISSLFDAVQSFIEATHPCFQGWNAKQHNLSSSITISLHILFILHLDALSSIPTSDCCWIGQWICCCDSLSPKSLSFHSKPPSDQPLQSLGTPIRAEQSASMESVDPTKDPTENGKESSMAMDWVPFEKQVQSDSSHTLEPLLGHKRLNPPVFMLICPRRRTSTPVWRSRKTGLKAGTQEHAHFPPVSNLQPGSCLSPFPPLFSLPSSSLLCQWSTNNSERVLSTMVENHHNNPAAEIAQSSLSFVFSLELFAAILWLLMPASSTLSTPLVSVSLCSFHAGTINASSLLLPWGEYRLFPGITLILER